MNTEEVEKEYCSRCPSYKYGCGFITRGLQDKCSQLYDYTDGYERYYDYDGMYEYEGSSYYYD